MMLKPIGFWTYSSTDDDHSRGRLSQLRALLAAELQQKIGRTLKVNIFQDVAAIPPGAEWEKQIRDALNASSFLIPIVTPALLQSEWCCQEITLFRQREETTLRRNDLIFPLHYISIDDLDASRALQISGFAASFAVISLLFAMMFKWLPDTKVEWRDVWLGAVLTAALFEVGKFLIGLYIGKQGLESTYRAAASIIVVLIWVYYSAQLVLMGAEFTNVYARRYGSLKHAASAGRRSSQPKPADIRAARSA
jgi:hypothetical protein